MALEAVFNRTPDGRVWTSTVVFSYPFWTRYLEVFDNVRVVARIRDVIVRDKSWKQSDGKGVFSIKIPYYNGPFNYLTRFLQIRKASRNAIQSTDAVILRIPGQISKCIKTHLKNGHPYGLEVVGDPFDVLSPGAIKHPLRPVFRLLFTHRQKSQCSHASAVAYVTEKALQCRYPSKTNAFVTDCSDIDLQDEDYITTSRLFSKDLNQNILISVGTMSQLYKGFDILIDAVSICVKKGIELKLILIGDGEYRSNLEKKASLMGLNKHIIFIGELPSGNEINTKLDKSDLFILPSRTEGLPRVMIEAMARGLPCIGTRIGGIPELLSSEDMVPAGDPVALASKILEVLSNPNRMSLMSLLNLEKAKNYHKNKLTKKRVEFYKYIRMVTEDWIKQQKKIF